MPNVQSCRSEPPQLWAILSPMLLERYCEFPVSSGTQLRTRFRDYSDWRYGIEEGIMHRIPCLCFRGLVPTGGI